MAKENFERTKPHINTGVSHIDTVEDTSGQLTIRDAELFDATGSPVGNPAPGSMIHFDAPAPLSPQRATVIFPVDNDFLFDPASSGPAESIDFQLDVLPVTVDGTADVEITFGILQGGEHFIVSRTGGSPSVDITDTDWTSVGQSDLLAEHFQSASGGTNRPDFGKSFQFGYTFTGEYSTTALSVDLGLDNMMVEITTIPEPTSITLALAMGAALLWHRWWGGDEATI